MTIKYDGNNIVDINSRVSNADNNVDDSFLPGILVEMIEAIKILFKLGSGQEN